MTTVAYLRISCADKQDLENQRFEINSYCARQGFKVDSWIEAEISSRKSTKKRKIDETLELLKRGDVLIISELSRIGRSVLENLNTLNELGKKKVAVHIIKQNLIVTGSEDIMSKMLLTNLSLYSELERSLVSQRTKASLARKRVELATQGKKLGNPRLEEVHDRLKEKVTNHVASVREIVTDMVAKGYTQQRMIDYLNNNHIPTAKGGRWHFATIQRVLKHLEAMAA